MSIPVCKFYSLNQTCRFGRHCRYLHTESQRPPPLSEALKEDKNENLKDQASTAARPSPNSLEKIHHTGQNESVNKGSDLTHQTFLHQDSSSKRTNSQHAAVRVQQGNRQDHRRVCHYFARYHNCQYGRYCKFSHDLSGGSQRVNDSSSWKQKNHQRAAQVPPRFRKAESESLEKSDEQHDGSDDLRSTQVNHENEEGTGVAIQGSLTHGKEARKFHSKQHYHAAKRICPFFKSGTCNRGERCRFMHPRNLQSKGDALEPKNESCDPQTNEKSALQQMGLKQMFTYAELDQIGLSKVRESEINVIKKRFPQDKIAVVEEKEKFAAQIKFSPSDPDWPFDVRVFELLITIPADYPKEMITVRLPVEQDLPESVRRYVEVSIKEWLDHKTEQLLRSGKVELVFRPFLRWLDRNMEEITTGALKQLKKELVAKAAGMEFIPAERLQAKFRAKSESSGGDERSQTDEDSEEEEEEEEETDEGSEDSSEGEDTTDDEGDEENTPTLNLDPEKKGTQISLQHLQLRENASALMFERLKLVLQCGRCKNHADLTVSEGRVMSMECDKCRQNQLVSYRPALIHQFSSVVGYLDIDGCQPFDLVLQDSRASVTCMACSKQTRIDGLVTGQMVDGWCQACNARFKVATEAVKFTHLVPSGIDTSVQKVTEVASTKVKRVPKDPAIKEGCPLPDFGTCKHYKHSYRWLRFPCCGKAYPCDVCHDKKENHEMIFANRMICGHCCKEQNFSASRPCNACNQHMTKIRSAHWEGGSGCRDKIVMSKNDQQKYKNMNKTQSNHKKKVQAGSSKKKTTKLRHA